MKTPHSVTGRTQPSGQSLGYFQDHSEAAMQGWRQFAGALTDLGTTLKNRQDKNDQFTAVQQYEQFQQDLNVTSAEQRRKAAPNDTELVQRQESLYDNMAAETLKKLPASQQAKFQAAMAEGKTSFLAGAYKFQYEQQDGWYRDGIKQTLVLGQNAVDKDWSETSAQAAIKSMNDKIDASDLPESEKVQLKFNGELLIRQAQYAKAAKENSIDDKPLEPSKTAMVAGGDRGKQLEFSWHELTTSESRAGTMLKNAGSIEEAVDAGLAYERPSISARANRIRNARAVLAGHAPKEAMQARAFYESKGLSPVAASGFVGSLMQESGMSLNPGAYNPNDPGGSEGIGQWNGPRKKAMREFTGQSGDVNLPDGSHLSLDDDPRFANIPLDQRNAMKEDAKQFRAREDAAAKAAAAAAHKSMLDDYLLDVYKGKKGKGDFYADWDAGKLDYEDVTKLEEAWNKNNKKNDALTEGLFNVEKGRPLTVEQDNAVAEHSGDLDGVQARDPGAYNRIIQRTNKTSTLAPVTQNMLQSMVYSSNPADAAYALKLFSALSDTSVTAFQKLPDDLKSLAVGFREQVNGGASDLDATSAVRGSANSPQEIQMQTQLRDNAKKIYLDTKTNYFAEANSKLQSIADHDGTLFSSAFIPAPVAYEFSNWYQSEWINQYIKLGSDASKATNATNALAEKTWTLSTVGDVQYVGRFMPEAVGYKKYEGSFDWMRKQLEDQVNPKDGEQLMLIADDTTRRQVADWQAGGLKPNTAFDKLKGGINALSAHEVFSVNPATPTWKVMKIGVDGIPRMTNQRVTFQQTSAMDARETDVMDYRDLEAKWTDVFIEWRAEQANAAQERRPPDPELERMFNQLDKQVQDRQKELYPPAPTIDPQTMEPAIGFGGPPDTSQYDVPTISRRTMKTFVDEVRKKAKEGGMGNQYTLPHFFSFPKSKKRK